MITHILDQARLLGLMTLLAAVLFTVGCKSDNTVTRVEENGEVQTAKDDKTYPPAAVESFTAQCVASCEGVAKSGQKDAVKKACKEHCDCFIKDIQAKVPFDTFVQYSTTISTGKQLDEKTQDLFSDVLATCATKLQSKG